MATSAAIIAKARRDIITHFLSNDSTSAERAILCIPDRRIKRRALERLVHRGVIVAVGPDRYFLSAPAYAVWSRQLRLRLIAVVLLAGALITASALWLR